MTVGANKQADSLSVHHDNQASIREGFAAFAAADLETVRGKLADDVTWTIPGTNALAGTYTGWDQVQGLFLALFEKSGGTLSNDLIDVLANENRAYAIMDTTATINGETKTLRYGLHYELADGLATSVIELAYDPPAADAFWA
jgi:ketosteroid isomerase-like protein